MPDVVQLPTDTRQFLYDGPIGTVYRYLHEEYKVDTAANQTFYTSSDYNFTIVERALNASNNESYVIYRMSGDNRLVKQLSTDTTLSEIFLGADSLYRCILKMPLVNGMKFFSNGKAFDTLALVIHDVNRSISLPCGSYNTVTTYDSLHKVHRSFGRGAGNISGTDSSLIDHGIIYTYSWRLVSINKP